MDIRVFKDKQVNRWDNQEKHDYVKWNSFKYVHKEKDDDQWRQKKEDAEWSKTS